MAVFLLLALSLPPSRHPPIWLSVFISLLPLSSYLSIYQLSPPLSLSPVPLPPSTTCLQNLLKDIWPSLCLTLLTHCVWLRWVWDCKLVTGCYNGRTTVVVVLPCYITLVLLLMDQERSWFTSDVWNSNSLLIVCLLFFLVSLYNEPHIAVLGWFD